MGTHEARILSYTRSAAFGENIGCAALWFLTVAVPELWAPVAPLACSSTFPKPSGRYSVLSQVLLAVWGSGMIEAAKRALRAG